MRFSVTEFATKRITIFIAFAMNIANFNGVNYHYFND